MVLIPYILILVDLAAPRNPNPTEAIFGSAGDTTNTLHASEVGIDIDFSIEASISGLGNDLLKYIRKESNLHYKPGSHEPPCSHVRTKLSGQ